MVYYRNLQDLRQSGWDERREPDGDRFVSVYCIIEGNEFVYHGELRGAASPGASSAAALAAAGSVGSALLLVAAFDIVDAVEIRQPVFKAGRSLRAHEMRPAAPGKSTAVGKSGCFFSSAVTICRSALRRIKKLPRVRSAAHGGVSAPLTGHSSD